MQMYNEVLEKKKNYKIEFMLKSIIYMNFPLN